MPAEEKSALKIPFYPEKKELRSNLLPQFHALK